jgi:hypothetical protein
VSTSHEHYTLSGPPFSRNGGNGEIGCAMNFYRYWSLNATFTSFKL